MNARGAGGGHALAAAQVEVLVRVGGVLERVRRVQHLGALEVRDPARRRAARIFFSEPSRIGRAIPSSSTIWQARSTLMLSPSGNTMRLGAFFARWTIRLMIVYCVPPMRRCSRSRYSSRSSVSRADARLHRRLGDRRRAPPEHARVERLRDDVVGPEAEAVHAVRLGDAVGHRLVRQLGQRARRGDLHRLVDLLGAHVERAPEDVREPEHVVDLVRKVAAAGRDDGVGARRLRVGVADLRIGVGEREDRAASSPSSSASPRVHSPAFDRPRNTSAPRIASARVRAPSSLRAKRAL